MPEHSAPDEDGGFDDRHRLSMTILMTPDMSNFAGNVHGGTLLKYLDQVAYTCATRYARNYAVTLSVDQVVFREPIHVGELVTFQAVGQPHRPDVDGDRRPGDDPGPRAPGRPAHQQLLLHDGRRRAGRPRRAGSVLGTPHRRGAPPARGGRSPQGVAPGDRAGDEGDQVVRGPPDDGLASRRSASGCTSPACPPPLPGTSAARKAGEGTTWQRRSRSRRSRPRGSSRSGPSCGTSCSSGSPSSTGPPGACTARSPSPTCGRRPRGRRPGRCSTTSTAPPRRRSPPPATSPRSGAWCSARTPCTPWPIPTRASRCSASGSPSR